MRTMSWHVRRNTTVYKTSYGLCTTPEESVRLLLRYLGPNEVPSEIDVYDQDSSDIGLYCIAHKKLSPPINMESHLKGIRAAVGTGCVVGNHLWSFQHKFTTLCQKLEATSETPGLYIKSVRICGLLGHHLLTLYSAADDNHRCPRGK